MRPTLSEPGRRSGASTAGADVFGVAQLPLLSAQEAAAWDLRAREEVGVPERVLMENAGRAVATLVQRFFPEGLVAAAVGGGHNGGDALVALRILASWGRQVGFLPVTDPGPDLSLLHGHEVLRFDSTDEHALGGAAVLLDGLLGTGARGAPRDRVAAAITQLNAAGPPLVAVDIPSGVDPDTGAVPGEAVRAVLTVSFGAPKRGLLLHPGRQHCGRIVVAEIGFPPRQPDDSAGAEMITPGWASARVPRRPPKAHKGTSGTLLVLAGSGGMAGAAALVVRAAARSGCGLVRVLSDEENRVILQTAVPEAVFESRDAEGREETWRKTDAAVVGPGIGTDAAARTALERVLVATRDRPTLLDADALNCLAGETERLRSLGRERPLVLTPHPRELHRLASIPEADILADPLGVAVETASSLGCVLLLKGQPSVVAAPGEPVLVTSTGSSDTAKGGMGDQLSGVIGAFLAAGVGAREAAGLGLFFSGRAADLARRGVALLPQDVSAHMDDAFARPGAESPPCGEPFVLFEQPPRW